MKNIILILLTLLLSSPAFTHPDNAPKRSNQLLRFLAKSEGLRKFALYSVISRRCKRYLPEREHDSCFAAVAYKVELMDFNIIFSDDTQSRGTQDSWNPKSFVFVAFKKDFIRLLEDKKTETFLMTLNERLNKFLIGQEPNLNIWDLAVIHYRSQLDAARAMAVLFQDTSLAKLHLAYLEQAGIRGRMSFESNKALLSRVINTVNLILDYSEDNYRTLFYPRFLQEHLNRNIYHFYVPLYLAMQLQYNGVPRKYAYIAPFLLTLSYEFITAANDFRYLYTDPEALDPVRDLGKIRDIYGGYCGSSFGAKGLNFWRNFQVMRESFARSTTDTIWFLFNNN